MEEFVVYVRFVGDRMLSDGGVASRGMTRTVLVAKLAGRAKAAASAVKVLVPYTRPETVAVQFVYALVVVTASPLRLTVFTPETTSMAVPVTVTNELVVDARSDGDRMLSTGGVVSGAGTTSMNWL